MRMAHIDTVREIPWITKIFIAITNKNEIDFSLMNFCICYSIPLLINVNMYL